MKRLLQLCILALLLLPVQPGVAATSLLDHYYKALEADPQNPSLRYHLGIALLNQGQNRQALEAFRRVYNERSDDPEINFNLALVTTRLQDPDSAQIYLDQAQANGAGQFPEIYPLQNAYFNLVLLYEAQGRIAEAVSLLRRLSAENPDHSAYLRLLGDFELRRGHVDAAVDTLGRYLKQVPGDSEIRDYIFAALFNRGLDALESQHNDAARQAFSRALQFKQNNPRVLYYLTLLDYRQGRTTRVVSRLAPIYPQIVEDQKENARAILYNAALALKKDEAYPEALQALAPLTSVTRPRSKDLLLAAGILFSTKEYDPARDTYLRVLKLDQGNVAAANGVQAAEKGAFMAILNKARAGFERNDLLAVRTHLQKAAEIYPQDNRLRIYQARLDRLAREDWLRHRHRAEDLETEKKYSAALAALREGLRLAPKEKELLRYEARLIKLVSGHIDALYRQGREAFSAGRLLDARQSFEQLLKLNPSHKAAYNFQQKIDQRLQQQAQRDIDAGRHALSQGDLLIARHAFDRALKIWPDSVDARTGQQQTEKLLTALIAETLVEARRARTEGRFLAARDILMEGLANGSFEALEAELVLVDERLSKRRASVAGFVRAAIDKEQFFQAAQLLEQAKRLELDSAVVTSLGKDLRSAQHQALDRSLTEAREAVAAGNYDRGLRAYRRALDLSPSNAEAFAGLKRGRAELKETISRYLTAGASADSAGKSDQARRAYGNVLSLDPHHPKALAALRKLEYRGPSGLTIEDSRRLYLQGIELYTEGDYSQAIGAWRQVLDLDPANEKAQRNIDKARRKLEQIRERQRG